MKLILLILLLQPFLLFSQTPKIDSLNTELQKAGITTSEKVKLYNQLGITYMTIGMINEGKNEFNNALANKNITEDIETIRSLAEIGNINSIVGNNKAGLDTLMLAIKLLKKTKINEKQTIVARLYKYIGDSYSRSAKYDQSLEFLMKSINIAEQLNDKSLVAKNQNSLAINYSRLKNFGKSIESNVKALEYFKTSNEIIPLGNTYSNIATSYKEWGKNDSAIKYINLAESIYSKFNYQIGITAITALKAEIAADSGQEEKALRQYRQILELDTKMKISNNLGYDYQAMGIIFQNKKQPDSSNYYLNKALVIFQKAKMSKEIATTYNAIVDNYIALKKVDSINKYLVLYKRASEDFLNEEKIGSIAKNEVQYETKIKEAEIDTQKKQINRNKKQKYWLWTGIGALLICCTLITLFYIKQFKRNKHIQKQKQEILHNNRNNIQQLISIFSRQSEDETLKENSIANRERLYTLNLLNKLLYENGESNQANINDYLTQLGAAKEISSGKNVSIIINAPNVMLSSYLLKDIGLIINELTTNSIKYAFNNVEKPFVNIKVENKDNYVNLKINDNGKGLPQNFNIDAQRKSFGLDFVKDLVEQHHGSIKAYNDNGANFDITLKV